MRTRYIIPAAALAAAALGASAQYNPTIEVEGTYKPEIIDRDRVNMFPERMRPGTLQSRLEFDTKGIVTDFLPIGVPMEATAWQADFPDALRRGYVELMMGSWLDTRLRAGYNFVSNANTWAGVYLRHNSTSLWKPDMDGTGNDTNRWLYDESIGFFVRHNAPGRGFLDADLRYNVTAFNYYGFARTADGTPASPYIKTPTQTSNDALLHVLWTSAREKAFQWHAGADLRYLGMRVGYTGVIADGQQQDQEPTLTSFGGVREIGITPKFGLRYRFASGSAAGVDVRGEFLTYTGQNEYIGLHQEMKRPETYGMFTVIPYYSFSSGKIEFRVGPRIDLVFNSYSHQSRFNGLDYPSDRRSGETFHLAPELRMDWHGRGIAASFQVLGGARLNSMAYMRDMSPYCQPFILSTLPTYSPLDSRLSLGFGPFAGFRGEISVAYRIAADQRTGGLYTAYLNGTDLSAGHAGMLYGNGEGYRSHGVSVGLKLAYNYGQYIDISAEGTWQRQDGRNSYFNGWDLPEATLGFHLGSNPWSSLRFGVDYSLRALRHPAFIAQDIEANGDVSLNVANDRLPNMSQLNFNASYEVIPRLTVKLELDNLLNRRNMLMTDLPTPGITILGGVSYVF